jgi:pimeloyl-ACP methyl ester carboxylesterase
MPNPRKLRLADVKIANETLVENCSVTTSRTPGRTWRLMIHSGLPPVVRAASTNKVSRIANACPRTSLATGGHITKPITRMRLRRLAPTMTVMIRAWRRRRQADADPTPGTTLIATGEHDVGSNTRMARFMPAKIPGSRLEILPGLRHSILVEAPELVSQVVRQMLELQRLAESRGLEIA